MSSNREDIRPDGRLTQAEALAVLRVADEAARAAKRDALRRCQNQEQVCKVLSDCIACSLAYTGALRKSLKQTGPQFEENARQLRAAAQEVAGKSKQLKTAAEAVNLLADAVRLARSLTLAFA
ncbi:MAG: hypothetical protein ACTFAL_09970 [Candidatus Electronema sp. V4]|uniref:hypothetical protein n=1 Tax=Candidatus Electronema sp. V4 TaxID=3454756 RepID=UPI0040553947